MRRALHVSLLCAAALICFWTTVEFWTPRVAFAHGAARVSSIAVAATTIVQQARGSRTPASAPLAPAAAFEVQEAWRANTGGAIPALPALSVAAVAAELSRVKAKVASSRCAEWKCDNWSGRMNCTAALPSLVATQAAYRGSIPSVPAQYCGRTLVGAWQFEANSMLDLFIYWLFFRHRGAAAGGTFVEFGGQNGIFASNSRVFERHLGWHGMLIEPVCFTEMKARRPSALAVRGAVCDEPGGILLPGASVWCKRQADVRMVASHTGGKIRTPCVNIRTLADAHFREGVDFMSIDMEGAEMTALRQLFPRGSDADNVGASASAASAGAGAPLLPAPIAVLLVEWRKEDGTTRAEFMEKRGYSSLRIGGDELFWREDLVRAAHTRAHVVAETGQPRTLADHRFHIGRPIGATLAELVAKSQHTHYVKLLGIPRLEMKLCAPRKDSTSLTKLWNT